MNPVSELQWREGMLKYASMRKDASEVSLQYYRMLLATRPDNVPLVELDPINLPPGYALREKLSERWNFVDKTWARK
jgi:hypothetical protein